MGGALVDQADAIDALVALGADPGRDVYRGTPLAWAAALGRTAALRRLLDLGVDPSGRTTFGGPDHGEDTTPLHLAASDGQTGVIAALLEAGGPLASRRPPRAAPPPTGRGPPIRRTPSGCCPRPPSRPTSRG